MNDEEVLVWLLDQIHKQTDGSGCGDGNCKIVKPTGMHTNGGCKCVRNLIENLRQAAQLLEPYNRDMSKNLRGKVPVNHGGFVSTVCGSCGCRLSVKV
jgi:hypothetical protein